MHAEDHDETRPATAHDNAEGPPPGSPGSVAHGGEVIKACLKVLPNAPGVYRMLGQGGDALYVGKARNLRKRVYSYTQAGKHPTRVLRMIAATRDMEFVVTRSEVEALLLEANLIKKLKPRYNILLRDDKTFPHILIASDHTYPQITKHRGTKARPGRYFGPIASAGAVNRTITALQRAFLLRNCPDTVFSNRSRPCLQYQIKRCTAPCVGYVDEEAYGAQVSQAVDFLSGKSHAVQESFATAMVEASERLEFETAARLRDRIRALTAIQAHQDINLEGLNDADAMAAHQAGGHTCIQVYFIRGGRNYGTRAYFPSHDKAQTEEDVLAAFLAQFYDNKQPPPLVLVSHAPSEAGLLAEALALTAGHRVHIAVPKRGGKKRLIDHALANAREALGRRLADSASQQRLLRGVAETLGLAAPPQRIEVYDNSHISGTDAVGAMIVAGPEGLMKNAYRKFNVRSEIAAGDDYAMMREVLSRRFKRAMKEDPERSRGAWPDLVIVDGGVGQLGVAHATLAELGIDDLSVLGIAKGPDRNAGRERLFLKDREPISLGPQDPVLYFLQRLRDEAHRFAIGTHRARRGKQISASLLDGVPGIGARRKKALLMHFGSARAVARASVDDLKSVDGISEAVARKVYGHLNPDGVAMQTDQPLGRPASVQTATDRTKSDADRRVPDDKPSA